MLGTTEALRGWKGECLRVSIELHLELALELVLSGPHSTLQNSVLAKSSDKFFFLTTRIEHS